MAKRKSLEELEDRAGRKLARAQAEFQLAQEKRTVAITKGEQMVERARSRASRLLTRSTKRVERKAAAVARAEARLVTVRDRARRERSPSGVPIDPPYRDLSGALIEIVPPESKPEAPVDGGSGQ